MNYRKLFAEIMQYGSFDRMPVVHWIRLFGNFDKRVMARGRAAIQAEIERLLPLMEEGGFIVMPDHLIPPDVPLDDYRWYLDRVRELRF